MVVEQANVEFFRGKQQDVDSDRDMACVLALFGIALYEHYEQQLLHLLQTKGTQRCRQVFAKAVCKAVPTKMEKILMALPR